jgi:hypothetical protein
MLSAPFLGLPASSRSNARKSVLPELVVEAETRVTSWNPESSRIDLIEEKS